MGGSTHHSIYVIRFRATGVEFVAMMMMMMMMMTMMEGGGDGMGERMRAGGWVFLGGWGSVEERGGEGI